MNKTFEEVEEMCIRGTVTYLAPGGTYHLPRKGLHWKTMHEKVSKLEGVKWVAWSGDPIAQYTFQIEAEQQMAQAREIMEENHDMLSKLEKS